ncbi:hypothetical protein Tco_1283391 [Tanacetum coccineum]
MLRRSFVHGTLDFKRNQILELESPISNEDIRTAVWGCGVDKSPGPDGFTFEFFRKYWTVVGPDFCIAVKWFFDHGVFAIDATLRLCSLHKSSSSGKLLMILLVGIILMMFHLFWIGPKMAFHGFVKEIISSSKKAWDETINKMKKRLSRWKLNTLSVGGCHTLRKSVLGSTPIYNMSIFKVPKKFGLYYMESMRSNFFNGIQRVIDRLLGSKGSRCLLLRNSEGWESLVSLLSIGLFFSSGSIITEVNSLKVKGVDLISHCKIRVGKGTGTSFWKDIWIDDNLLKLSFPRLFALEENKGISVA